MALHHRHVHLLAVLPAVVHHLIRMGIGVLYTLAYARFHAAQRVTSEEALSEDAAQGDRKSRIFLPPLAEVKQLFEFVQRIGKAALVDNKAGTRLSL